MATESEGPDGMMDGIRDGWVMGGDGGWLEVLRRLKSAPSLLPISLIFRCPVTRSCLITPHVQPHRQSSPKMSTNRKKEKVRPLCIEIVSRYPDASIDTNPKPSVTRSLIAGGDFCSPPKVSTS